MIDVLIIGSGIAGLTAALNASESNSKVLVVSKTYPTHSQSVQAQGGINAVLYEDDDSVDIHCVYRRTWSPKSETLGQFM